MKKEIVTIARGKKSVYGNMHKMMNIMTLANDIIL